MQLQMYVTQLFQNKWVPVCKKKTVVIRQHRDISVYSKFCHYITDLNQSATCHQYCFTSVSFWSLVLVYIEWTKLYYTSTYIVMMYQIVMYIRKQSFYTQVFIYLGKYPISYTNLGYYYAINFVKKQFVPKPQGKYPIDLKPYLQPCYQCPVIFMYPSLKYKG